MELLILGLYFVCLSVLCVFGLHGLLLIYFYHKSANNSKAPVATADDQFPLVTVQIPLYNEIYVAERIVEAVARLDWPQDKLEIQVLDDSTDETKDLVANIVERYSSLGFDIVQLHREDRSGFKAGALKAGLETAKGEFIAIFDADFVPKSEFLQKTIPYLVADDGVGMVQTRWEHINEDYSYLTRAQALALDGHFVVEQQVRNNAGFFINFNGTAGVWRKSCIEDAGNWQSDTLTEDLDLSYRAQMKGWRFKYLNDVTSPAELPAEINALKSQQFRWTKGAIETARKHLPAVWKSKVPLIHKIESTFHLGSNIVFPLILLVAVLNVPLVVIKNEFTELNDFFMFMSVFVVATMSTFLMYMYSQREVYPDWQRRILLFPLFLAGSMGLSVNNTKAVLEGLVGIKSAFIRTPKYRVEKTQDSWQSKKYAGRKVGFVSLLEVALALYFLVGVAASIHYMEIAAIPFQLMFFFGFGVVGYLSLKHAFQVQQ